MRRVVVLVLDGLRRDLISPEHTPELVSFAQTAEQFSAHRSVFPSATRVVSASFSTGCYPARHELQGNSMVLAEGGRLVAHDAGHPDFLQHKRRITGRSLAMPTIAERVKDAGGAIIFSNVSPGAAYAHDPDGHGYVYHRAGCYGPGRIAVPEADWLHAGPEIADGHPMARRFVDEVVLQRRPAFALMWLAEPDWTQHYSPLGSPKHLSVLAEADRVVGWVREAVAELRRAGDDVLFVVGSDHGHQTVTGEIDVDAELIGAGLKADATSGDVVTVSNGTSSLVYVHPEHARRIADIGAFLRAQSWAGRVIAADELASIGQAAYNGLAFAVHMADDDGPNPFGIPGTSVEAKPAAGKTGHLHFGQHGGLAKYEQMPFLMINGDGFAGGGIRTDGTSIVDIAPTILTHLGLDADGMDGRALQRG